MKVRGVVGPLPLQWLKTCRCPWQSRRCRRLGCSCCLLIVIQLALTGMLVVRYDYLDVDM